MSNTRHFEIVGDSLLVINWINWLWRCKYEVYGERLAQAHRILEELITKCCFYPRHASADWAKHTYRELNQEADELAGRHECTYKLHLRDCHFSRFRLFFDGSHRSDPSGGGWLLYGSSDVADDNATEWSRIAELNFMHKSAIVTAAELESSLWGMAYLLSWMRGLRTTVQQIGRCLIQVVSICLSLPG